jgi:diguanylate cyclase (GGDEF)-like protein
MQFINSKSHAHIRSGAARISVKWLVAASIIILLGFCTICGAILWEMRRADWEKASQASKNVVATIEADITRNIESYDLLLQAVIDGLKLPEFNQVSKETRQAILFDRAATAKYLGEIRVLDAAGNTIINSRSLLPQEPNRSEQDYFKVHIQDANAGLYVSRPSIRDDGQFIIGISRRLANPDGSFAGAVVGTLQLSYFDGLFRKVNLGPESTMGLTRTDGTMLMRSPFSYDDIGRDVSKSQVFKRAVALRSGQFEEAATIDGIHRLYTFKQVGDFPLIIMVGVSTENIYAGWRRNAWSVGLLILALCSATFVFAMFFARELKRRAEAEQALSVLANTDSLTGLSNRRHFDEVFDGEWQRSMRQKTEVAVLMIDVDCFKTYNDSYGHLSGDKVLEAIAGCISNSTRRATDFTARYGGEEFVLLLPSASPDAAFAVAERIRKNVMALGSTQSDGNPIPTVSIGVASNFPKSGMQPRDLINAADQALYEAKRNGRNRTELAGSIAPMDAKLKLVVNQ